MQDTPIFFVFFPCYRCLPWLTILGLPQNLWVKKLGLCPRPQDFQGMARVSNGGRRKKHPWQVGPARGLMHRWRTVGPSIPCRVASPAEPDSVSSAS